MLAYLLLNAGTAQRRERLAGLLWPDYPEAYYTRGHAHFQKGEYDPAIADYNQAIQLDPDNAQAYYKRGVTHENFGHPRLAMIDFEQAINLDPDYAAAYSRRGNGHLNSGNFELACNDFRKACELGDCAYLKWAKKNGNCRQ